MSYETALREDAQKSIEEIGQADILVGIPSYKNANTIGHVVRMAAEGMVRHFPRMKPVLVNSDGGSPDGTRQVVLDTPVPKEVEKIVTVYQGVSGKGSSFRTIFEIARALGVNACVVHGQQGGLDEDVPGGLLPQLAPFLHADADNGHISHLSVSSYFSARRILRRSLAYSPYSR